MAHARAKAAALLVMVLSLPAQPAWAAERVAAAPVATKVSAADQATILALHNQYRAAAGVAPLVWDDQLASDAQAWADALVARGGTLAHSNPADANDPDTGHAKGEGENLAGGQSAATAPSQWYEEKPLFDAAKNKSGFNDTNPDWVNWGHYTQMMWSATTKIGCGTAPGPIFQITSCRYSPPGNFDGQLAYPTRRHSRSAPCPRHRQPTAPPRRLSPSTPYLRPRPRTPPQPPTTGRPPRRQRVTSARRPRPRQRGDERGDQAGAGQDEERGAERALRGDQADDRRAQPGAEVEADVPGDGDPMVVVLAVGEGLDQRDALQAAVRDADDERAHDQQHGGVRDPDERQPARADDEQRAYERAGTPSGRKDPRAATDTAPRPP